MKNLQAIEAVIKFLYKNKGLISPDRIAINLQVRPDAIYELFNVVNEKKAVGLQTVLELKLLDDFQVEQLLEIGKQLGVLYGVQNLVLEPVQYELEIDPQFNLNDAQQLAFIEHKIAEKIGLLLKTHISITHHENKKGNTLIRARLLTIQPKS